MASPAAVVIVTWNGRDEIVACLQSALREDPAEIVIVDNGSTDDTLRLVAEVAPSARIVELGHNRGFSAGCNAGIEATRAPYVLFLNSDAVLAAGYVTTLIAALEADSRAASAVGKLVFEEDGKRFIDSAGIDLRLWAMSPLDRGHGEPDAGQYDRTEEVFGPSAAAALYRREALAGLGEAAFDEELFAYYEDVDLAWRLRRRGWKHLYVPGAVASHPRRGPDAKPAAIAARAFTNRALVWLKNDAWWHLMLWGPFLVAREMLRLGRLAAQRPELLPAVSVAFRRMPAVVAKRWRAVR
jgi:GT2 family glycosyltransferase